MEREPHFCLPCLLPRTSFFAVSTKVMAVRIQRTMSKLILKPELLTGNKFLIKERLE